MSEPKDIPYVNLASARSDDQRKVLARITEDGVCPFCPDHLARYHTQKILRRGIHWVLTPNQWPYDHTQTHLIAIATTHVEYLADVENDAFAELLEHFKWAEKEYSVDFGAMVMRFGDTKRNGASVRHLHAHFIVPDKNRPDGVHVRVKVS